MMEAELLGEVIVFRSEMLVLDNKKMGPKWMDWRKTGDVIARSQGKERVRSVRLLAYAVGGYWC